MSDVENLKSIITDILNGDPDAEKHPLFAGFSMQDVLDGYKLLTQNQNLSDAEKARLASESWRLHYKAKPPTIEEFLKPEYLGATSDSIWPYIKQALVNFWDPRLA